MRASEESTGPFQKQESLFSEDRARRAPLPLKGHTRTAKHQGACRLFVANKIDRLLSAYSMVTRWKLERLHDSFGRRPKTATGGGNCSVERQGSFFVLVRAALIGQLRRVWTPGPHLRRAAVSDLEKPANGRHLISFPTQTRFSPTAGLPEFLVCHPTALPGSPGQACLGRCGNGILEWNGKADWREMGISYTRWVWDKVRHFCSGKTWWAVRSFETRLSMLVGWRCSICRSRPWALLSFVPFDPFYPGPLPASPNPLPVHLIFPSTSA